MIQNPLIRAYGTVDKHKVVKGGSSKKRQGHGQGKTNMVKAKDIMTEPVITVRKDTPMYEVAQLLSAHDISGVPVVDDDMNLEGVITEKDVLDIYHVMQYKEARTVSSSMSRDVTVFDSEDDLDDICQCLKDNPFRRVPVTSEGKVVGIISRRDLILYMLKLRRKNEGAFSTAC